MSSPCYHLEDSTRTPRSPQVNVWTVHSIALVNLRAKNSETVLVVMARTVLLTWGSVNHGIGLVWRGRKVCILGIWEGARSTSGDFCCPSVFMFLVLGLIFGNGWWRKMGTWEVLHDMLELKKYKQRWIKIGQYTSLAYQTRVHIWSQWPSASPIVAHCRWQ